MEDARSQAQLTCRQSPVEVQKCSEKMYQFVAQYNRSATDGSQTQLHMTWGPYNPAEIEHPASTRPDREIGPLETTALILAVTATIIRL